MFFLGLLHCFHNKSLQQDRICGDIQHFSRLQMQGFSLLCKFALQIDSIPVLRKWMYLESIFLDSEVPRLPNLWGTECCSPSKLRILLSASNIRWFCMAWKHMNVWCWNIGNLCFLISTLGHQHAASRTSQAVAFSVMMHEPIYWIDRHQEIALIKRFNKCHKNYVKIMQTTQAGFCQCNAWWGLKWC